MCLQTELYTNYVFAYENANGDICVCTEVCMKYSSVTKIEKIFPHTHLYTEYMCLSLSLSHIYM